MKKALIIFTRVPEPGKTKTRLESKFTKEECAKIHEAMLADLCPLCNSDKWDTFVYYTPARGREKIEKLLPGAFDYRPQENIEFGERMKRSIGQVLEMGYEACLLVGTDIPVLNTKVISEAFDILKTEKVVIGATKDQGYYLIGMTVLYGGIFDNQNYGTGSVYSDTVEKIKTCVSTYGTLPVLRDIDESEDVEAYWKEFAEKETDEIANTWKYLCCLHEKYNFDEK